MKQYQRNLGNTTNKDKNSLRRDVYIVLMSIKRLNILEIGRQRYWSF